MNNLEHYSLNTWASKVSAVAFLPSELELGNFLI